MTRGVTQRCEKRFHDALWLCPLHGCPDCLIEFAVYQDPGELIDGATYWATTKQLVDQYTDRDNHEDPCLICSELLHQTALATYPGLRCELADCTHCTVCGACTLVGHVCLVCRLCTECLREELGHLEVDLCMDGMVWNRARRVEIPVYRHTYAGARTGLRA